MLEKEFPLTNLVKFYILLVLYGAPTHGYKIMKELESKIGKRPSPGEVYPFLCKLTEENYLKIVTTGGRGKKVYSLTDKGEKLVEHLVDRLGGLLEAVVEAKLTACANCGCKIYEGGVEREVEGKRLVFCCIHCASNYEASIKGGMRTQTRRERSEGEEEQLI